MFKYELETAKGHYLYLKNDLAKHARKKASLLQDYTEVKTLGTGLKNALLKTTVGSLENRTKLILGIDHLLTACERDYKIDIEKRKAASKMKDTDKSIISKSEKAVIVSSDKEIKKILKSANEELRIKGKDESGFKFKKYIEAEATLIATFLETYKHKIDPQYPSNIPIELIRKLIAAQTRLNEIIESQKGSATALDVELIKI